MAKHTPGPWMWWDSCSWRRLGTADQSTHIMEPIVQKDGHSDLHFHNGGYRGPDAQLIAASPEMLGLIWKIYQGLHCQDDSFAGMTDSEITDAINDEMHNLLGDQWEHMKKSRQD